MTEAVRALDDDYDVLDDEHADESELSTVHLNSGLLEDAGQPATDWLAVLTASPLATELLDDEPPRPLPQPSGMSEHRTPPRMRPTIWSRLTGGLRRMVLLLALSGLAVGALAGGAYLVWPASSLPGMPSQPQSQPQTQSQPPRPAPPQTGTQAQPQSPQQAQRPDASAGSTAARAKELRDKGIAQFKEGKYN